MASITRSRLEEIKSLVGELSAAMDRGASASALDQLGLLVTAVTEVNASLADVEEMLLAGLRDEAMSMHDPELVAVARLLDLRSRSYWIPFHGWLLERGQTPPAPVNIDGAELFAGAFQDVGTLREDLAHLRKLALERAPLRSRLAVLRRLRVADPAGTIWIEAVAAHEEARIRELRLAVPRALDAGDIESLADVAEELADPAWDHHPPSDLLPQVAGAVEARELSAVAADAEAVAAEISRLVMDGAPVNAEDIETLTERRERLLHHLERVRGLIHSLAAHPRVLGLIKARGLDTAVPLAAGRVSAALERIARLSAEVKTKRDFEDACRRIEYLCDHPPQDGGERRWLAELERCDLVARAACQELPQLAVPALVRERLRRAAAAVESRERLRQRFWLVTCVSAVAGLLAITGAVVWFTWRSGEYTRTVGELERRVAEARGGLHLERPAALDQFAGRYAGDARVEALVEDFEAAVGAEKQRVNAFKRALAEHGERVEEFAAEVSERRSAGEEAWLEAWPPGFVTATRALAEVRRCGGLPDRRGVAAGSVAISPVALQRFQAEENDVAAAEARQAELDGTIARLAQQAFDRRLTRIQDRMADVESAADVGALLAETRALRERASAARADGLPNDTSGSRVPAEAVATLDSLETKLRTRAREADRNATEESR